MLFGIKFSVMRYKIVSNELKQFRENFTNGNWFVIAHSGMVTSFKYWYNRSFFPSDMEMLLSQAQVGCKPKNRNRSAWLSRHPQTQEHGIRIQKNAREGYSPQGHSCYKLTEIAWRGHQQLQRSRRSKYHQHLTEVARIYVFPEMLQLGV
jgi:hypothetical protein